MKAKDVDNFNFSMPKPLAEAFRVLGNDYGTRNKMRYAVAGAAVLKLMEVPEDERKQLIARVLGARANPAELAKLISEAEQRAAVKPQGAATKGGKSAAIR